MSLSQRKEEKYIARSHFQSLIDLHAWTKITNLAKTHAIPDEFLNTIIPKEYPIKKWGWKMSDRPTYPMYSWNKPEYRDEPYSYYEGATESGSLVWFLAKNDLWDSLKVLIEEDFISIKRLEETGSRTDHPNNMAIYHILVAHQWELIYLLLQKKVLSVDYLLKNYFHEFGKTIPMSSFLNFVVIKKDYALFIDCKTKSGINITHDPWAKNITIDNKTLRKFESECVLNYAAILTLYQDNYIPDVLIKIMTDYLDVDKNVYNPLIATVKNIVRKEQTDTMTKSGSITSHSFLTQPTIVSNPSSKENFSAAGLSLTRR